MSMLDDSKASFRPIFDEKSSPYCLCPDINHPNCQWIEGPHGLLNFEFPEWDYYTAVMENRLTELSS
jgi:hypothetical protein